MKKHFQNIQKIQEKSVDLKPWQLKINRVIHGTDTWVGKFFDVCLLVLILLSVIVIMLESVSYLKEDYYEYFFTIEWVITGLFTIEYILRLISIKKPIKYIFSFFGIIDILSILPTYLTFFIAGTKPLTVLRVVRFLRIFRILELGNYLKGANVMVKALYHSRHKIIVFIISMLTIVIILGGIMYSIESPEAGFTSIPRSIYWAIITITTVGYGDIAPLTSLGQAIASIIMLIGYSIIAVPTGIVSAEVVKQSESRKKLYACHKCDKKGHENDALFCKYCGAPFKV